MVSNLLAGAFTQLVLGVDGRRLRRAMSIEDTYNFRRIHEDLTTSGLLSAEQLGDLHREGYEAVINLMPDGENSVADEARIVQDQGLDYVYIPVDFDAPTRANLEAFFEAMDARSSDKVHVHCAANYRVSAFYSLYALRRGLCTQDEATELVQSIWNPAEFPAWTALMTEERTRAAS
jgi:uncharacterized protein (TIGR01244 family)